MCGAMGKKKMKMKYKDGGKVDAKGQGAQVKPNLFSGIY